MVKDFWKSFRAKAGGAEGFLGNPSGPKRVGRILGYPSGPKRVGLKDFWKSFRAKAGGAEGFLEILQGQSG